MTLRKLAWWAAAAFAVFLVIKQPHAAAGTVRHVVTSLGAFASSL